jgi:hypothetical protein
MLTTRTFSQRLTNQFQASPSPTEDAWTTYLWTDAEMQTNLINFAPTTKTVVGSVITFNTEVNLIAGINQIWVGGLAARPHEILIDMGKEYSIGLNGGDSRIVVMRRVQRTSGTAGSGGVGGSSPDYDCYWTPILNKLSASSQLNTNPLFPILPVTVSRI